MTKFHLPAGRQESNNILSSQVPLPGISVATAGPPCCLSPNPLPCLLQPSHGQQLSLDCGEQSAAPVGTGVHKKAKLPLDIYPGSKAETYPQYTMM